MNAYAFFGMNILNALDVTRNSCIDFRFSNGNGVAGMLPFVTYKCGYCRHITDDESCTDLYQAEEFDLYQALKRYKYVRDTLNELLKTMQKMTCEPLIINSTIF